MKSTPDSLILICLNVDFGRIVAKRLAVSLDKVFVDGYEVIERDLLERQVKKKDCNLEYLAWQEQECIKNCSKNENSIIYLTFELYKRNKDTLKGIHVYYLQLPILELSDNDKLNRIAYSYRNEYLMKEGKGVIKLEKTDVDDAINKLKTGVKK